MSWARCSECGQTFTGDKWFDRHRRRIKGAEYDWRCATPDEMTGKGWAQTPKGWWQGDPGRPIPLDRMRSDRPRVAP